ncbi:MAG: transcription termination factor Rho [Planctomycetota bacterium]|nr:transcription termination factor Rho [Planctomycetota bacterium]
MAEQNRRNNRGSRSGSRNSGGRPGAGGGGAGGGGGGEGSSRSGGGNRTNNSNRRRRSRSRNRNRGDNNNTNNNVNNGQRQEERHDYQEYVEVNGEIEPGDVHSGVVDIVPEGFGFLRNENTLELGNGDAYVPTSLIKKFRLKTGQLVSGPVRPPQNREKHPAMQAINSVEGMDPELATGFPDLQDLTPLVPNERLILENSPLDRGTRIIDLLVPVGKGTRGIIVAPPKGGKTMLLQETARAVAANHPDIPLFILLIDERPEEVTDFRSMGIGKVVASSFDSSPQSHLRIAELCIERCQRLVEAGKDVFLLLDSLTRLTRTVNVAKRGSGRALSGGLDAAALQFPRKLLGAARNIENGGSLTILATALVETDSRMDEVIFEEFKGTGNWELKLDRKLADRRLFPAFDLSQSGTRREELLYTPDEFEAVRHLRRNLLDSAVNPLSQMEALLRLLDKHKTNNEIIEEMLTIVR